MVKPSMIAPKTSANAMNIRAGMYVLAIVRGRAEQSPP
jgi:hypothetical protein